RERRALRDRLARVERDGLHGVHARRGGLRLWNRRAAALALLLVIREIGLRDLRRAAIACHAAVLEPQRAAAQLLHVIHAVRAQKQRAARAEIAFPPCNAFLLERLVADREHLVGDQDFW